MNRSFVAKLSLAAASIVALSGAAAPKAKGPILAAFAHPDDELIAGPLLARLAREGRDVHLVITTDGSKGVRPYAGIPAGPQLAAVRKSEAECAVKRLGVQNLHLIGMENGVVGKSLHSLADLRTKMDELIERVQPEVIITFGPDGFSGHPEHRLTANIVSEVVQSRADHRGLNLFYTSLPIERVRSAPQSILPFGGAAEKLLTVRIPVDAQDIAAARESFACHKSQFTPAEMDSINQTMGYIWNGMAYLRPWDGPVKGAAALFRP